jgi:hypothetical protein
MAMARQREPGLRMSTGRFACFGYGSLVNRATLPATVARAWPARLKGWRRHWQARDFGGAALRDVALLSVRRDDACELDGIVFVDANENLDALDRREARYKRVRLDRTQVEPATNAFGPGDLPETVYLYVGNPGASPAPKLLQSYLDVVLAGFHREFGEAGVARFLATTDGFDREIVEDRAKPIYARALKTEPHLLAGFDAALARAGVRYARPVAAGFSA